MTIATQSFGVSVRMKVPEASIIVQEVLNWHSMFKWLSVMSVLFITWTFLKGHVIPYLFFLSTSVNDISLCFAFGFIWMTWFLVGRYKDIYKGEFPPGTMNLLRNLLRFDYRDQGLNEVLGALFLPRKKVPFWMYRNLRGGACRDGQTHIAAASTRLLLHS